VLVNRLSVFRNRDCDSRCLPLSNLGLDKCVNLVLRCRQQCSESRGGNILFVVSQRNELGCRFWRRVVPGECCSNYQCTTYRTETDMRLSALSDRSNKDVWA